MKLANRAGRLILVDGNKALDVATASDNRFDASPQAVYEHWEKFSSWARDINIGEHPEATTFEQSELEAVAPRPAQVFAVGLNYRAHAQEANLDIPENPLVFTKYVSSFAGPTADIELSGDSVDWEVELVAVIGKEARNVTVAEAWEYVAGLTLGQDISDRALQWQTPPAQFGIGKSLPNYSPMGPVLVTLDEIDAKYDKADLALSATILGADGKSDVVQQHRTSDMIFSLPELIEWLSRYVTLLPGDVIFTGTPAGVGAGMKPPRFLKRGETLVSQLEGVGELRNNLR